MRINDSSGTGKDWPTSTNDEDVKHWIRGWYSLEYTR